MSNSSESHDTNDDTALGSGEYTGAPRRVKLFGILALVVAVVVIILLLSGGGHGPGRHTSSSSASGGFAA